MKQKPKRPLLVGLVTVEMISAVLAWRGLSRRSAGQVRGKKARRALILMNPETRSRTGLEEVLVNPLEDVHLMRLYADVVPHEQPREVRPVDEDDAGCDLVGVVVRVGAEPARRDEDATVGLGTVQSADEPLHVWPAHRVGYVNESLYVFTSDLPPTLSCPSDPSRTALGSVLQHHSLLNEDLRLSRWAPQEYLRSACLYTRFAHHLGWPAGRQVRECIRWPATLAVVTIWPVGRLLALRDDVRSHAAGLRTQRHWLPRMLASWSGRRPGRAKTKRE